MRAPVRTDLDMGNMCVCLCVCDYTHSIARLALGEQARLPESVTLGPELEQDFLLKRVNNSYLSVDGVCFMPSLTLPTLPLFCSYLLLFLFHHDYLLFTHSPCLMYPTHGAKLLNTLTDTNTHTSSFTHTYPHSHTQTHTQIPQIITHTHTQ